MNCAFIFVSAILWIPWFGNRSGAAWGKEASQTEPGLSSLPWCTPHHRPGLPRPSSGFWWRTTHRYPSSQPTLPKGSQQSIFSKSSLLPNHWLPFLTMKKIILMSITLPKLPFPKTMMKLKSESLTRSWLPLLSYLHTEEEEEESVGFPGPTLARWMEGGATNKINTWTSHSEKAAQT